MRSHIGLIVAVTIEVLLYLFSFLFFGLASWVYLP